MSQERVLAISTTAIGDTIMSLPAIELLAGRYQVEVLTHQGRMPLFAGHPSVSRVHAYRNSPLARAWLGLTLGRTPFYRVLILHANDNIKKLLPRLRYQEALNLQGWRDEALRLGVLEHDHVAHAVDKRVLLARALGVRGQAPARRLHLTPAELREGQAWLAEQGLARALGPLVGLCPGAALPYKMWPAARFGQVAAGLAGSAGGVVVLGSSGEKDLFEQVAVVHPASVPLLGRSLRLAAAVLAGLDLLITNDTGTMHLAIAVGTPVLAIFGPSLPDGVGPRGARDRVLQVELPCEPCLTKRCPHPHCLEALTVEEVLAVAREMLAEN